MAVCQQFEAPCIHGACASSTNHHGVENSPAVIPVWFDLSPDSLYLEGLHTTQLDANTEFDLLFGHRAGSSLLSCDSSDGTISLKSQLDPRAQDAAHAIRGFDEGHRSILDERYDQFYKYTFGKTCPKDSATNRPLGRIRFNRHPSLRPFSATAEKGL